MDEQGYSILDWICDYVTMIINTSESDLKEPTFIWITFYRKRCNDDITGVDLLHAAFAAR